MSLVYREMLLSESTQSSRRKNKLYQLNVLVRCLFDINLIREETDVSRFQGSAIYLQCPLRVKCCPAVKVSWLHLMVGEYEDLGQGQDQGYGPGQTHQQVYLQ